MTRDDIIRTAREAGWGQKDIDSLLYIVETAAAAEREACARMAEAFHQHGYDFTGDLELHEAIRARGQA
jgi:hypothetical protein